MNIQKHISLSDKTWFQTGGPARFFAEPTTAVDFQKALAFARTPMSDIFVLGQGANILISDDGFNGLVIRPQLKQITHTNDLVKAQAGVSFHDLIDYCLMHNLQGLEEFSGIPGTVGGSVFINIHYFEFLLDQFLTKATVIERKTGAIHEVPQSWFDFGYNQSKLHTKDYYLVDATFKLKTINAYESAYARGRRDEIIRHRNRRYPQAGTCGSFFRNFALHEVPETQIPYVAYYLDKVGVRGTLHHGGAYVSKHHANMIVNLQNASSQDIIQLARAMQQSVIDTFDILPQPECQLIGFTAYPLLTR